MSKEIARHFWTGIWVAIFGLVGVPLALVYWGIINVGELLDNPLMLAAVVILYFFAAFTLAGWAARMGVQRVR